MLTTDQHACLLALNDYNIYYTISGDCALSFYGWPHKAESLTIETLTPAEQVAKFAKEKSELFAASGLRIERLNLETEAIFKKTRKFAIKYETEDGKVKGRYVQVLSPLELLKQLEASEHFTPLSNLLLRVRFLADVIERENG